MNINASTPTVHYGRYEMPHNSFRISLLVHFWKNVPNIVWAQFFTVVSPACTIQQR